VNEIGPAALVDGFLVFSRVAMCVSFAPGFSSPRIPMRIRLLIAIGLTAAIAPAIVGAGATSQPRALHLFLLGVVTESAIGLVIGLVARFMVSALETMGAAVSMSIGLTSAFAPRIDDSEYLPELATLLAFTATMLIFLTDLHWQIVRAVAESFTTFPLGAALPASFALEHLVGALGYGFVVSLRIASPFLIFGLLGNLAFGLIGRLVPQIQTYFLSTPFLLAGGLALLLLTASTLLSVFLPSFEDLLRRL